MEVSEHHVLHVQRRLFTFGGGDDPSVTTTNPHHHPMNNGLASILFQPLAGDCGGGTSSTPELHGMRFGILDAEVLHRMAVVLVTNPATTEAPGCLSDLRMGASAVSHRPCETCHQEHHNFPDVFVAHIVLINCLRSMAEIFCSVCSNCCTANL